MNKAMYAGSFDPFTNGHLYVLKQACDIFEHVIVVVSINSKKTRRLDKTISVDLIKNICKEEGLTNVSVIFSEGLVARVAEVHDIKYQVKGLRNGTDFEYEENMAIVNEKINPNLKTIYFRAGDMGHISSSVVCELYRLDGPEIIKSWVSDIVLEAMGEL